MKTRWLRLLCPMFLMVLAANSAHAQSAQEIARKAFGSTLLLVMEDANKQVLSLGSGFFVGDGEIATNLHVVEGAARGYAKLVGQQAKYDIQGITAVDPQRDLVVLKISATHSQPLPFGNSDAVQVGETVYAVGNPQGLEGTFSQGIVSSVREVGANKLLQITAPISPGSSGGPVLNGKAEVIGVSVATFRAGQNLNFAIPANYLKALLGKRGPAKPLAQAKPAKAQRSLVADLGGRSSQGVVGGQLAWDMPDNQFHGGYSFSLRNQLRENVRNVYCLVVFHGAQGKPIEVDLVRFGGLIPAGLAKRVTSEVHPSIGVLTKWRESAVEFRILDFELVNEANSDKKPWQLPGLQ
ncbi:MAG TPA: S1C family serine protease [Syntrophorhabdales bacterium]|nr:S1C family serine protease [Syntrophorhabdales bacterium]